MQQFVIKRSEAHPNQHIRYVCTYIVVKNMNSNSNSNRTRHCSMEYHYRRHLWITLHWMLNASVPHKKLTPDTWVDIPNRLQEPPTPLAEIPTKICGRLVWIGNSKTVTFTLAEKLVQYVYIKIYEYVYKYVVTFC